MRQFKCIGVSQKSFKLTTTAGIFASVVIPRKVTLYPEFIEWNFQSILYTQNGNLKMWYFVRFLLYVTDDALLEMQTYARIFEYKIYIGMYVSLCLFVFLVMMVLI